MTLKDLRTALRAMGWSLRVEDGELEAYPRGRRGLLSAFESNDADGRVALLGTVRAEHERMARKIRPASREDAIARKLFGDDI